MRKERGFRRLTLVLSVLVAVMSPFATWEWWFKVQEKEALQALRLPPELKSELEQSKKSFEEATAREKAPDIEPSSLWERATPILEEDIARIRALHEGRFVKRILYGRLIGAIAMGFASIWLVYAFIRWVVFVFIKYVIMDYVVKGFRSEDNSDN